MTLPSIYTVGYEGADIIALIAALQSAGVNRVADIRHSPYSKRPEFSKDELQQALHAYGIAYTHIEALGNTPAGRDAARLGHMAAYREIFAAHLDSPIGRKGLQQLIDLTSREVVCMLCLEKSASHCHRGMVAARLHEQTGQVIEHLRVSAFTPHPAQHAFDFG